MEQKEEEEQHFDDCMYGCRKYMKSQKARKILKTYIFLPVLKINDAWSFEEEIYY